MTTASSSGRKGSAEKAVPHTRIEDDSMISENYKVGKKIGQGSFGKVYEATHKSTGVKWAIKSINKEKAGSSALKLVEREVSILKRVSHPHVITLNEVIESPKKMYLVMELCTGGELADVLKEKKYFSEVETKQIMERLASGIAYLHKNGIVHRDMKLENVLMAESPDNPDDKLHVKVTDFGLSVAKGGVTPDSMMQDFCGTPIYMAPEILDNKSYSQQCDVWALGIIMYTLLCGYPPFRANDENMLYDLIREGNVIFEDEIWCAVSEEGKNCILGMLKTDPAHRLSAAEVLNHHWITGETRDPTQPTNVLEMMKVWREEMQNEDSCTENSIKEEGADQVDALESRAANARCASNISNVPRRTSKVPSSMDKGVKVTKSGTKQSVPVNPGTSSSRVPAARKTSRAHTPSSSNLHKGPAATNGTSKPAAVGPKTSASKLIRK